LGHHVCRLLSMSVRPVSGCYVLQLAVYTCNNRHLLRLLIPSQFPKAYNVHTIVELRHTHTV